jgi:hypothetical protein
MGISLFGLTPAATYPALIKFGDNSAISGTLRALSDGLGNDLPIQVSNTAVNFTGTLTVGGAGLNPVSGVSGAIQFSNGSAFASDAANLFWDDTNNRLGIGTNAPTEKITAQTSTAADGISLRDASNSLALIGKWFDSSGFLDLSLNGTPYTRIQASQSYINTPITFGSVSALSAIVGIKGSGSTSATTSLLVQNSAGTAALTVKDDLTSSFAKGIEVTPSTNYGLNAGYLTQSVNSFLVMREGTTNGYKIAIGTDGTGSTIFYNNQTNASFVSGEISLTIVGATKNVLIGTTTDVASSLMTLASTTKGFLPPRMTTTQRDAIVTPATGLRIYNTTTNTNDTYNGTAWQSNSVSGVAGAIQFSNGSAFASDATNLFWDDTNNRLGVGTNAPTSKLQIVTDDAINPQAFSNQTSVLAGTTSQGALISAFSSTNGGFINALWPGNAWFKMNYGGTNHNFSVNGAVAAVIDTNTTFGNGATSLGARLGIKGSGTTSATTSLLVQNSAAATALEIKDNLTVGMGGAFVNGASGFGITVASITATYPCFLMNSTSGGGSKIGLNVDTAKLYFSEETSGAVYGHRVMADTRNGGLVVLNNTAAGSTASLNASAVLQADSTTKGFLPPRMTTTQKNAIATPAAGLVVYDNTTNKLNYNNGTVWKEVTPDGYTGLVTVNATPPVAFDIQNGIIVNVT